MTDQTYNLYPGIVAIEYFNSALLNVENPDVAAMSGMVIEVPEERFSIPMIEPGSAEVKIADGIESISIKFSAQIKIYPPFRPAFIFKDANGVSYLVASKSKPFPKVSMIRTFGSVPDKRPEVSYEITHTALHTPIEIAKE